MEKSMVTTVAESCEDLYRSGSYTQVLETILDAIDVDATTVIMRLIQGGTHEMGLALLKEAGRIRMMNPRLYGQKMGIFRKQGENDKALKVFEEAGKTRMLNAHLYDHKIEILCDLGKYDEALRVFDEIDTFMMDHRLYNSKMKILHGQGNIHEALRVFEEARRDGMLNAYLYNRKMSILRSEGKLRDALEAFEQARAKEEGREEEEEGREEEEEGREEEEEGREEEGRREGGEKMLNEASLTIAMSIFNELGRGDEADQIYEKMWQDGMRNAHMYNRRMCILHERRKNEEALEVYKEAERSGVHHTHLRCHAAFILLLQDREDQHIQQLVNVVMQNGNGTYGEHLLLAECVRRGYFARSVLSAVLTASQSITSGQRSRLEEIADAPGVDPHWKMEMRKAMRSLPTEEDTQIVV